MVMKLPAAEKLAEEVRELESQMSDPAVMRNTNKMKGLAQQHADLKEKAELAEAFERVEKELSQARELLASDDGEMRSLAEEDETRLLEEKKKLEEQLETLLIPRDPRDSRDVILEIRAGAGGDEASLFAAELLRAYTRFAERHGWKTHVVSSSMNEQGGYKEVIAEVSGRQVFGILKFERGVHRVQRVPETEKQGRIHTSTITVAVMPQAEEVDMEIKPEDLRIDTYRSSGAGGQHVNKTSSAIRITHLPTNTVVAVQDERSQHKNKEKAMSILRSRLLEAEEERRRSSEASERKQQVGTGDRSEKIRTYNFPQDRITDHRIKQSWSNIESVMEGWLDKIFQDLREAERKMYV
ncbi:MAG: peptide chain release factor 1 [Candidatus Andersenbacteria bacterium]|nr:peptide chain release factor 1 [bacterium]MDZ4225214.1 peptide chain release factor 1 [Candidatus Andersenbacteria bacterium]